MKKDTLKSIKKITDAITGSMELEAIMQTIVNVITDHFTSIGGVIFQVDKERKEVVASKITNSELGRLTLKIVRKDFDTLSTPYDKPVNKLGECVAKKRVILSNKAEEFICPTVSKHVAKTLQKIGSIKSFVAFPAIMNNEVVGVVLLAFKEDEKYVKEMMPVMELFIDQVAIAINNALKYKELQDKHDELQMHYEIEKEISALLSHELKTPLAIANNNAQLLRLMLEDEGPNMDEVIDLYNHMERGIKRVDDICNSIFSLREIEHNVPQGGQMLNLKYSLQQVINEYKKKAEKKGLKFYYTIRENSKGLVGPGIQFEQVLMILIDNAVKYTKKGSVQVKVNLNKKSITAEVSDTGPGIPRSERENIYKRFNRIKKHAKQAEGLGLGLYIAKKIVDKLDGQIHVGTNPTSFRGTRFKVEIPLSSEE